jgi:hypothetical protein
MLNHDSSSLVLIISCVQYSFLALGSSLQLAWQYLTESSAQASASGFQVQWIITKDPNRKKKNLLPRKIRRQVVGVPNSIVLWVTMIVLTSCLMNSSGISTRRPMEQEQNASQEWSRSSHLQKLGEVWLCRYQRKGY